MNRLILGVLATLLLAASTRAQVERVGPSAIEVHDLTMARETLSALHMLALKYHIVIAVYGTRIGVYDARENQVNISLKQGTLGEVFDTIVRQHPNLRWKQADDGAIHFVLNDPPPSLFDVVVHSFDADNPRRWETLDRLKAIPEVAEWLKDQECTLDDLMAIVGRPPAEWGKFVVHAKHVPLSAILDEIASKSGTYFWMAFQNSISPCEIDVWP